MITILCSGSRGDIQPYIALAQQLMALGRDVRIAAGVSFIPFITSYGIGVYPLSADYKTIDIDPEMLKAAQSSDNPLKMLLTFNKMKQYAHLMTEEMYSACEGSELIIYHPGCTIGYFAAQQMGIPAVLASPFPMHKTAQVASVIAYGRYRLPTKITYTLLQNMLWMAGKTGVAGLWKLRFGRLPDGFGMPFERVSAQNPAIISCSNFVFKKPSDQSPHIHQCGYWFVEEDDYTPPKEIEQFLESGEKPIYIGFGSISSADEQTVLVKLILDALQTTNQRGILCGMGKINDLPDSVLAIDNVPHSYLFDKVSTVCHHGGAGTSAHGFRSGIPSIIIPHSNDQFAWAHRAYDLGVASPSIPRKRLTAAGLAGAISYANQQDVKDKAKVLAQNIATEHGAHDCAVVIDALG